ncbi:MAG: methyl-accepting chemotaxis protein, partial [Devosia sp.]
TSIEEVTAAVRTMDEMTQHNAALVEETNAAIEQTEAQASELDRIVDIFAIDQAGVDLMAAPATAPRQEHPAPAKASQKAAKAYLSQGNAAIAADWDEF